MRDDILKVIHERPKGNRTWISERGRVKQVLLDCEGEHFNQSAKPARPRRQNYTHIRFQAVNRFLIRSVGRLLAKVFSEICAQLDVRTKGRLGFQVSHGIERRRERAAGQCYRSVY